MKLMRSEYYVDGTTPVVVLFTRDGKKTKITRISDFRPYFYFPAEESHEAAGLEIDNHSYETIEGGKVLKAYVRLPEDVPVARSAFSMTWEADIPFGTRYVIDKVDIIEPTVPRIHILDIEVDSDRVPDPRVASSPVTCICVHDSDTDTYNTFLHHIGEENADVRLYDDRLHNITCYQNEKEMLSSFVGWMRRNTPNIITGWNTSLFDVTYLISRMGALGINFRGLSPMGSVYLRREDKDPPVIKGIALLDLYSAYRKLTENQEESYRLDYIARKVTGEGKIESGNDFHKLWVEDPQRLISYNANDVRLCRMINDKLRLIDFLEELRRITFCQLEDTTNMTRPLDCYILKTFHGRKVFPTRTEHESYTYEGAFVGNWAKGIYDRVAIFDLKSLYPSLIITFGLSPETVGHKDESSIEVNGIPISRKRKGFLPEIVENLFKERSRYRKLMDGEKVDTPMWKLYWDRQYALKKLLNALYGQTAYVGSRIYNPRVAETITYLGREIILWSKNKLEEMGLQVIYADTDSCHWVAEGLSIEDIEFVRNIVNDSYRNFVAQWELDSHRLQMEFQEIFRKAFYGSKKKRYASHIIWKEGQVTDSVQITGFETKRSDSSQFSRNLQKRVFEMLLKEDATKELVNAYVKTEIDRVREEWFLWSEIGIPRGINKPLDSYKPVPAHVRGAIYARNHMNLYLSMKPKLLYVRSVGADLPRTDVVCFDDDNQVPQGTILDTEKMLDKLVKDKLKSIYEALGWRLSELAWYWKTKTKHGEQLKLM